MKYTEVNSRRATKINIWEDIRLGRFNGEVVYQGKKERIKVTKLCDMCGVTILRGKHCKPCSDKVRGNNISYSKPFWEK